MKKIVLSILLITVFSSLNAQKEELKNLQKALKSGNVEEISKAIALAETVIESSTPDFQAQLYFQKATAYNVLYEKNHNKLESVQKANKALNKLFEVEQQAGKNKFTLQAIDLKSKIKAGLVNEAIDSQKKEKYKSAHDLILNAYKLSPIDTTFLFYAAQFSIGDKNYEQAIGYLEELVKLNFSDIRNVYTAVKKSTNTEEEFSDKTIRDISVRSGDYTNPKDTKTKSKRGDIVRTLALLYVEKKDIDKAKKAFEDAKKSNPDDMTLLLTEANMYLDIKEYDTYKKIVNEILAKNPNDADLLYNLGVISSTAKENDEAIKHYKSVIAINPNYANAYLNLAVTILEKESALVEKMNALGNTAADNRKYDMLKKEREKVFEEAMPYLEKFVELDKFQNIDAAKTLMSIYMSLDLTDKYKALKAKI